MSEKSISKNKIRECLIYTILDLVIATILLIVGIIYFSIVFGAIVIAFALVLIILGGVSLLFYFRNPEIMCGIWIGIGGTRRVKKYNNKNIRMGRKILLVYMIIVICIMAILLFMVFPRL